MQYYRIEELERLLVARIGGHYHKKRDELIFQICPFCGNSKDNFEINLYKMLYHCWAGGEGGSIKSLLYKLGIEYDKELPEVRRVEKHVEKKALLPADVVGWDKSTKEARDYLHGRGITDEDIAKYRIMWWPKEARVVIPLFNAMGALQFWTARFIGKSRSVRKYLHAEVPKNELIMAFYGDQPGVYLVEGIFDALRLHKGGKTVIVLMGTSLSTTIVDYLRSMKQKAYLALDSDATDRQLRHEEVLVRALGRDNVEAIYLTNSDVADAGLHGDSGLLGYVKRKVGG